MKAEIKVLVKAAIYHKGKILLVRREKKDSLGGYWDFPSGHVEFLETRKQAIAREVMEETGLRLKKFQELNTIDAFSKNRKKQFILTFYKAESSSNKIRLSEEHDAYIWVKKFPSRKLHPLIKLSELR